MAAEPQELLERLALSMTLASSRTPACRVVLPSKVVVKWVMSWKPEQSVTVLSHCSWAFFSAVLVLPASPKLLAFQRHPYPLSGQTPGFSACVLSLQAEPAAAPANTLLGLAKRGSRLAGPSVRGSTRDSRLRRARWKMAR